MASTPVEFEYKALRTLTADLVTYGDVVTQSAMAATERTNAKGVYRVAVTATATGQQRLIIKSNGNVVAIYTTEVLADDTNVYLASDRIVTLPSDSIAAIQSGLATSANQTTILNRIGAFTGSGVNTVLGFFKALMSKTASNPSDLGGTFDAATDSTEAVSEAVAEVYEVAADGTIGIENLVRPLALLGSTGNDTTHVHLNGLSYPDDELNGQMVILRDTTDSSKLYWRWIEDWDSSGALATVALLPFTPTNTDFYSLTGIKRDGDPTAAAIRAEIDSNSTQLAAILAKWTTAMTEDYAVNGAEMTPEQAFYAVHQMLMDFIISGTSNTVRKLDGATTAFVVTMDDATNPTANTRTT